MVHGGTARPRVMLVVSLPSDPNEAICGDCVLNISSALELPTGALNSYIAQQLTQKLNTPVTVVTTDDDN